MTPMQWRVWAKAEVLCADMKNGERLHFNRNVKKTLAKIQEEEAWKKIWWTQSGLESWRTQAPLISTKLRVYVRYTRSIEDTRRRRFHDHALPQTGT